MTDGSRRRFKTILFDLYDTLIWVDVPASNRWREMFAARAGVPVDRFMGAWRGSMEERMSGKAGMADHLAATLSSFGIAPSPALIAEMIGIDQRRLEETTHYYPDTVTVLRKLAAGGYRLGLVSNVSDSAAHPIAHLRVDQFFDKMILSHEVGILKPDPAIFEFACRSLDSEPGETMFVADGGFGELDAAHNLGIFSVLVRQDHQSPDFGSSSRYDETIHGLRELAPLLSRVEGIDTR